MEARWRMRLGGLSILIALFAGGVWTFDYLMVMRPVAAELGSDPRNSAFELSAHYRLLVDPTTLVLDLRQADGAAPLDLLRGLFQSARALHAKGRTFDSVLLAHRGRTIYRMRGADFASLGESFGSGENPIYLTRTLPEKLYLPTGEEAFGHWQGGLLGVVGKQIEDVNVMARRWARGEAGE